MTAISSELKSLRVAEKEIMVDYRYLQQEFFDKLSTVKPLSSAPVYDFHLLLQLQPFLSASREKLETSANSVLGEEFVVPEVTVQIQSFQLMLSEDEEASQCVAATA